MSKEIQKHFSRLENALKAAGEETRRYNEEIEKVKSNKSLSKIGQDKQIKPLTASHEEYSGDLYSIVKDVVEALEVEAKNLDANLDFVGDQDLANALKIIEYVGNGAPEELVQSLNQKYGSNPVAARTLKAFYRKPQISQLAEAFGCKFGISTAEEPKPGSSSMRAVQTYQDYVSQGPVL